MKGHLYAIIFRPFLQCGNSSMAVDTGFGSTNLRCNSLSRYGSNLNWLLLAMDTGLVVVTVFTAIKRKHRVLGMGQCMSCYEVHRKSGCHGDIFMLVLG